MSMSTESYISKNYLEHKVKVLKQIGLTDKEAVRNYLIAAISNAKTESVKETRLDNAARKLMMDFYDGDQSFIKMKR